MDWLLWRILSPTRDIGNPPLPPPPPPPTDANHEVAGIFSEEWNEALTSHLSSLLSTVNAVLLRYTDDFIALYQGTPDDILQVTWYLFIIIDQVYDWMMQMFTGSSKVRSSKNNDGWWIFEHSQECAQLDPRHVPVPVGVTTIRQEKFLAT